MQFTVLMAIETVSLFIVFYVLRLSEKCSFLFSWSKKEQKEVGTTVNISKCLPVVSQPAHTDLVVELNGKRTE